MPEDTQDTKDTKGDIDAPESTEGDNLPENAVSVEDCGTLKKKVTVTVPRARIDAKMDEMFGELGSTAQVPGFRIGRAPRRLIEKRFGREVGQDVRRAIIGESLGDAIEKSELKVLGEPDLDLEAIELPDAGDMEFSFEVEIAPQFDLPEIKGIELARPVIEITDERVDEALQQWREAQAKYEPTEDAAAEADTVTADATISGDGLEEFKSPGLTLRVAPGQIEGLPLVDLGKELTGKKAGDTVTLTVKVPEAHPNESWRGKELTVAVHISQVNRRVLPELNDQFASVYGFDSLEKFRAEMRHNMEARIENEQRQALRDQVCKYLLDGTKLDVPEGAVARHTAGVLRRRYVDLLQRGVPREKIDENLTELQAAAGQQATQEMKLSFILDKICEEQDIQVSEEEINSRIAEMASAYNRRPDRLRQELAADGSLEQVSISLKEQKALDKLMAEANVKEVSPAQPDQAKPGKASKSKKAVKKPDGKTKKKSGKKVEKKTEKKAAKKAPKKAAKKVEKKDSDK